MSKTVTKTVTSDATAQLLDELGRVVRELTRIGALVEDDLAMTASQRLALYELSEAGPLRLNDLATRMGTSAPTASRAVDALVELGFVERLPDASDRRAVRLELTEAGQARVNDRTRRVHAAFEPAAAALSEREREQLGDLLARLATELHA